MDIGDALIGGVGKIVDDVLTGLGVDDSLADLAGLAVNLATGNTIGAVEEGLQLLDDLKAEAGRPDDHLATPAYAHPAEACPAPGELPGEVAGAEGARENGWRPPVGGPPGARESLAAKLRGILGDPSLSLEDKISLLFSELLGGLDEEIETKMDGLQTKQAAKEAAERPYGARPANGGEEVSAADISRLSSELQILMQRRAQMQALLSNVMGMSHQSAMQTISNIR